jgi:hypothetical protein
LPAKGHRLNRPFLQRPQLRHAHLSSPTRYTDGTTPPPTGLRTSPSWMVESSLVSGRGRGAGQRSGRCTPAGTRGLSFPTEIAHIAVGYTAPAPATRTLPSYSPTSCPARHGGCDGAHEAGLRNSRGRSRLREEYVRGFFCKRNNATCHSQNGFVLICTRMPSYCTA